MKKKTYENPESELITVRFEENILLSGEGNSANNGYDDENDLGEI